MARDANPNEPTALQAFKGHLADLELRTILVSLGILAAVLLFAVLAEEVGEGSTTSFDTAVLAALRDAQEPGSLLGPRWLESFAVNMTSLGGWAVSTFLVLAVLGFLLIRRAWLEMALVAGSTIGGVLFSSGLKYLFARPRPDVVPHLVAVSDPSFPSGHAMVSAVIYITLGTLIAEFLPRKSLKAYVMGVALFTTFIIGLTRVFLGVHYPSDVVAGWCVGLGWAMLCWLVVRFVEYRLDPDDFELEAAREDAAEMQA